MSKVNLGKYVDILKRGINRLSPPLPVGGLYITDTALIYLKVNGKRFDKVTLRLPPGIVVGGKIKDKKRFTLALSEFRRKISPNSRGKIFVVLSLESSVVNIQTLSLPLTSVKDKLEATILNLRMISPISAENAYLGWQEIDIGKNDKLQTEILGAFVTRDVIDDITESFHQVGIYIVAIEFASLALARAIDYKKIIEKTKPYITVEVNVEGVQFSVIRSGAPLFHTFYSWKDIQEDKKDIPIDTFKSLISDEIYRILNFYSSRWGDKSIKDILIIAPALSNRINEVVKDNFNSLMLEVRDISTLVNVVQGSAIRGAHHQNFEGDINLANFSDRGVLSYETSINFIRIWRNLYVSIFGLFLAFFLVLDIFIGMSGSSLVKDKIDISAHPNISKFSEFERDAIEFNTLVKEIQKVRSSRQNISPLIVLLRTTAGDNIDITRMSYSSLADPIFINGIAINENEAISFKNRLIEIPQFIDVKLPLTNVNRVGDQVTFRLQFNITSLNF